LHTEFVQSWLSIFASSGYGTRTAERLELVEVSIIPNADEPSREEARVVLELTVTEDMLNSAGKMHGACIVHLVDLCTTFPIAVKGQLDDLGVSQNINVIYHAPASLGDKLRLINTSTAMGTRAWTARMEMWDVTHHRLVASATQVKMGASSKL